MENLGTLNERSADIVLVQTPVTSLVPNNPAGITSLIRSVRGNLKYIDLNEDLFLKWVLNSRVLEETVRAHHNSLQFQSNLKQLNLTRQRVEEVIQKTDEAREAFRQIGTYADFEKFVFYKKILEDAAKIISAPFIDNQKQEFIRVHHNTVEYYNSQFRDSRKSLLKLTESAALFRRFIHEYALPRLLEGNPNLVGISVTHPDQYIFAFQLAYQLRKARPETITLLGGNTVSRRPDTWTKNDEINRQVFRRSRDDKYGVVDGLVLSEGELALAEVTMRLLEDPTIDIRALFSEVPGIVFNGQDGIGLNQLPSPYNPESLWQVNNVFKHLTPGFMPEGKGVHSIVDGRVCTFECTTGGCEFCAISKGYLELAIGSAERLGIVQNPIETVERRYLPIVSTKASSKTIQQRRLGADVLADEIEKGFHNGFPIVDITDEQFTLNQALELSRALHARGLNVKQTDVTYSCYMRIDDAGDPTDYERKYGKSLQGLLDDPQILRELFEGGMRFVQFGLETTYPPKIVSMAKATTTTRIQKFGDILKNLADQGIMPHLFIIVGASLKEKFWADRVRFRHEEQALGRPVTANDLEILEAFYNLGFLHQHRSSIFTLKHTQFKLALHSPQANHVQDYGLEIKAYEDQERDLSSNVPFVHKPDHKISNQVLKDLLRLYDLWKKEELPYQSITQEFMYAQRIIPEVGAAKIKELAMLFPPGEGRLEDSEKEEKREILKRLWGQLVGREYVSQVDKLRLEPKNRSLEAAIIAKQKANIVSNRFPHEFKDYDDIYLLIQALEDLRK